MRTVPLHAEESTDEEEYNSQFHANYADVGYNHSCSLATTTNSEVGDIYKNTYNNIDIDNTSRDSFSFLTLLLLITLPITFAATTAYVLLSIFLSLTIYLTKCLFKLTHSILWTLTIPYHCLRCLFSRKTISANMAYTNTLPFSLSGKLPIVMDSGCTIAMTGDLSLFDRLSMKAHRARISLADKNSAIYSTHVGKITLNGQCIDALYVPKMSQTLLSLGWFLKQGFKVANDTQGNLDLKLPTDTPFLSFHLSNNNLFYLRQDSHSA